MKKSELWGALTPESVSRWITFDREFDDWTYRPGDHSMAARQAEGVAGLWNKLGLHGAALLADEVGTGKTLQALGVMALLWKSRPGAKVLVMAPNRDICKHWAREFRKFVKTHYRHSDGIVRKAGEVNSVHEPQLCWSLDQLTESVESSSSKLFITTIYSLSLLTRDENDEDFDRLGGAKEAAARVHRRLKKSLGENGFDLVVVDEAHYFRNSEGPSQRAKAAREFFGPQGARLGRKALLMTATPSHSSMRDVAAILGYVTDVGEASAEELLRIYALRRLRRMQGRARSHDKYSYRNEFELPADFGDDPAAEMFFALYQKLLVRKQASEGRRYLYGYLEGFESFDVQPPHPRSGQPDDGRTQDFSGARDTEILKHLSRMHTSLGELPAHPKYDKLVRECLPRDVFDYSLDLHEHKHLVFVRRIPSVREIAKRVNAAYDQQLGRKIVEALAPQGAADVLKRWQRAGWSREFFVRYLDPSAKRRVGEESELFQEDGPGAQAHPDSDADVHSHISNLFVVKKDGAARSTDCSNFSLRLRKSESIFCLLLEPARDYRCAPYLHYDKKQPPERERDDYATAARNARMGEPYGDGVTKEAFQHAMPSLWALMYGLLDVKHRVQLDLLASDPKQAESFGSYIKAGFLFASPVIVELYCWYQEFQRTKPVGDAASRYLSYLDFIRPKLEKSLALAYFSAALETFQSLCENVGDDNKPVDWHHLTGLSSPAFYASSAVKDRQRLLMGFNSPFYPNVLVSTSVLQEGVNLHLQCRKVHHYGIAWTPGDNEQRVGRVDRLFGKINAQLRQDDSAELAIHYPYLARSFDEEQLASFIRLKHGVESRMDACRQADVGSEIDLLASASNWRAYLRKRAPGHASGQADPFPYRPDERPAGEYRAYV